MKNVNGSSRYLSWLLNRVKFYLYFFIKLHICTFFAQKLCIYKAELFFDQKIL